MSGTTRYYRLSQIIGQRGVTEEEAARNRERGKGRKTPCPAIEPKLPISKSSWWSGVQRGVYPKPCRAFGPGIAVWKADEIDRLLHEAGQPATH